MRKRFLVAALGLVNVTSGCSPAEDHVLFVTSSSIGFDADSATGSVDLGFNRHEGVAGPSFKGGEVPPVYAFIESDGGWLSRNIDQRYATGDAARIIARGTGKDTNEMTEKNCIDADKGQGCKVFFVGTRTNFGLHIGLSGGVLSSVSLAFKRQELSFIPLGKKDGKYIYPAALASFNSAAGEDVKVSQLIATGDAAEALAGQPDLQHKVTEQAEEAFSVVLRAGRDQNSELISSAADDSDCLAEIRSFVSTKYPDNTPSFVGVTTALKYAGLRQEIVSDPSLRSKCNQFTEK